MLKALNLTPTEARHHGLGVNADGVRRSAYELLSRTEVSLARLGQIWPELQSIDHSVHESLDIEAKYAVYLDRQTGAIEQVLREEGTTIPQDLNFSNLAGLSNELKQKLTAFRPTTIAAAQKIDGMTPAAMAFLVAHVRQASSHSRSRG